VSGLAPGTVTDGQSITVPVAALSADEVVSGSPSAGIIELGSFGDVEIGIWEMTPGVATDTEADEVFIVLSGRAEIEFDERAIPPIEVVAGSIVRLTEGMRTTWTVTETLRKVYLA
jgi:uncharacterized cupin superfamily protein